MDLTRTDEVLFKDDMTAREAREFLQRNAISGHLFRMAWQKLMDPNWRYEHGPHTYVIDTLTNKGARVTYSYPYEDGFQVRISRRTGEALLNSLADLGGYAIDDIVFLD